MAPTIRERLHQFQEIQCNVERLELEEQTFKQKAAECQLAAATRVQELVTGLQESETLVQESETALSQELLKLADEAMARAQEAQMLANVVWAEVQRAQEQAAYFEGKLVYFYNKEEATAISQLRNRYHIALESRSSVHLKPSKARADLRRFARGLNII